MTAESEADIQHLKTIGRICALALQKMTGQVRPGITTGELDEIGRTFLESEGARSAPRLAYDYPGTTCISIIPVIAHGIPGGQVLKKDDLVHIDVSAELDGYYADTGASIVVSKPAPQAERLVEATRQTLWKALHSARAGSLLNEIGLTIQREARRRGYNILWDLTGHGIGRKLHEAPADIWNFYNPGDKRILGKGQVLAIEPFLTTGAGRVVEEADGWSLRTADKAPAAQFEHTIIVTKGAPIVLTVA